MAGDQPKFSFAKPRTGAYGILVALYKAKMRGIDPVGKDKLVELAAPHSDHSYTEASRVVPVRHGGWRRTGFAQYTAWSSMKTLRERKDPLVTVKGRGRGAKYDLTTLGEVEAHKRYAHAVRQGEIPGGVAPPAPLHAAAAHATPPRARASPATKRRRKKAATPGDSDVDAVVARVRAAAAAQARASEAAVLQVVDGILRTPPPATRVVQAAPHATPPVALPRIMRGFVYVDNIAEEETRDRSYAEMDVTGGAMFYRIKARVGAMVSGARWDDAPCGVYVLGWLSEADAPDTAPGLDPAHTPASAPVPVPVPVPRPAATGSTRKRVRASAVSPRKRATKPECATAKRKRATKPSGATAKPARATAGARARGKGAAARTTVPTPPAARPPRKAPPATAKTEWVLPYIADPEVVMLLDHRETKDKYVKLKPHLATRAVDVGGREEPMRMRVCELRLADMLWVVRSKSRPAIEYVLDTAVERKTLPDLVGSIKDGRFYEQKLRLQHSHCRYIAYIYEDGARKVKEHDRKILATMRAHARAFTEGVSVVETHNAIGTVNMLHGMHQDMVRRFQRGPVGHRALRTGQKYMPTLEEWNQQERRLHETVRVVWGRMLHTINGIGAKKAYDILSSFPTFAEYWRARGRDGSEGMLHREAGLTKTVSKLIHTAFRA